MVQKIKVDISIYAIFKVLFVFGLIAFLYTIRDILLLLFAVIILVVAFRPVVLSWSKKLGRPFALSLFLLMLLGIAAGFFYLVVPPFVVQSKQLFENFPDFVSRFSFMKNYVPSLEKIITTLYQSFGNISSGIINFTAGLFGGILTVITAVVLMIYLLIDEVTFKRIINFTIRPSKRDFALEILEKISLKIGSWFRGQMILGIIMGILTYIGLSILGIKYAIILGVVAGVMEIVPFFGPLISGLLASIVALSVSPLLAFFAILLTVVLHQLENSFLAPKILQKAIGLPPAVIIIGLLIGGKLLGLAGALLAAPILGIIFVIIQERETLKLLLDKSDE